MASVFADALAAARGRDPRFLIKFLFREFIGMPGSLFSAYRMAWKEQERGMGDMQIHQPDIDHTWMRPPIPWRQVFLAAAPFVLIWVLESTAELLAASNALGFRSPLMQGVMVALLFVLVGCLIYAFIYAARRSWPLWSATWYLFFWLLVFLPIGWVVSLGLSEGAQLQLQEIFLYFLFPLAVATTLYRVTKVDRLRGLLAALPILYILWYPNFEQTPRHNIPESIELIVKTLGTALMVLAISGILRLRDWRKGVWLVLAALAGVGLFFSYTGIYHGGMLPYTAQGPSPVEVFKSFLPQYLAVSGILFGPFLAGIIRDLGRRSGRAGILGYRLALFSLLMVITINLYGISMGLSSSSPGLTINRTELLLSAVIVAALAGYLAGLVLLTWSAARVKVPVDLIETFLVSVLPLFLPLLFVLPFGTAKWPISNLYGIPLIWQLPGSLSLILGLAWLFTTAWLVTRTTDKPAALQAAPQVS